jgi:hypothetical protein
MMMHLGDGTIPSSNMALLRTMDTSLRLWETCSVPRLLTSEADVLRISKVTLSFRSLPAPGPASFSPSEDNRRSNARSQIASLRAGLSAIHLQGEKEGGGFLS